MKERRRHPRKIVNVSGLISFDDGRQTLPCRAYDLSVGGALIKMPIPGRLPDCLSLLFDDPDQPLRVVSAWCHVARRGQLELALRFLHLDDGNRDYPTEIQPAKVAV